MLSGLDPLDEQVFRDSLRLPAEWGAWEQLNASRLIPAVARCTPDEGRRIRAREHEARIELVIVVPASPPEWRTVRGRPPMIPEFTVRQRIHTVADAVLVSAEGDRFPLLTVMKDELRPLAASSPPTPGVRAGPEEIARFVEAAAEQRWQDLRTRCPRCGGLKKCRTCEGRGYTLGMCHRCNGTGQIEVKCEVCKGTNRLGDRTCYACWAGRHLYFCPDCDDPVHGHGRVRQTCRECDGSGRCPRCDGTGRVSPP